MPLREDLLQPIPGKSPTGTDASELDLFDEIRQERKFDQDAAKSMVQGDLRETRSTDYYKVAKLAEDGLLKQTKDLWVAAYLTEAWTVLNGFAGLTDGLLLIKALLEAYWDNLFPALEGASTELRQVPLNWLGSYMEPSRGNSPSLAVLNIPLTSNKLGLLRYKESNKIPKKEEAGSSETKNKARAAAEAEGKVTPEDFDKAFNETPKPYYRQLEAEVKDALAAIDALAAFCNKEKFGKFVPSFNTLRSGTADVQAAVKILLTEKLKREPDPPPTAGGEPGAPGVEGGSDGTATARAVEIPRFTSLRFDAEKLDAIIDAELKSPDDAVLRLAAVARYFRRNQPSSPVSYLLLRGFRWGELRNSDSIADCLEAPPVEMRAALRQQYQAQNWPQVLEISETAMSQGFGRGWLDLQRYAVRACEELGYIVAAKALRADLKALLADLPQLPDQIMPDDTGVANPDTISWLRSEGMWSKG